MAHLTPGFFPEKIKQRYKLRTSKRWDGRLCLCRLGLHSLSSTWSALKSDSTNVANMPVTTRKMAAQRALEEGAVSDGTAEGARETPPPFIKQEAGDDSKVNVSLLVGGHSAGADAAASSGRQRPFEARSNSTARMTTSIKQEPDSDDKKVPLTGSAHPGTSLRTAPYSHSEDNDSKSSNAQAAHEFGAFARHMGNVIAAPTISIMFSGDPSASGATGSTGSGTSGSSRRPRRSARLSDHTPK